MSRCLLTTLTLVALAPLWCVAEAHAQDPIAPVEQARFLLRALQFDRALESRGDVRIAVLYPSDPTEAEALLRAFDEMGASGIRDLEVSAISVRFESTGALLSTFEEEGVTAVYIPESLATALSSIQQVTRARGLPSLTVGRLLVERGVSVGVFLSGGDRKMIVNLRSSKVEGLNLSSELLQVAEVIR